MARDYEDFSSIDDLDDDELRQLVRDRLADHPDLDVDDISVTVDQGTVRLEGRVGTEAERLNSGSIFGEMPEQDEPTVVEARGDENLDQRMFGTTNYQDAVAHGVPYEPPEAPTQEGIAGTDAGPGEYGEDH